MKIAASPSLPRFLPLSQAVVELGVSEGVLRKQVEKGTAHLLKKCVS